MTKFKTLTKNDFKIITVIEELSIIRCLDSGRISLEWFYKGDLLMRVNNTKYWYFIIPSNGTLKRIRLIIPTNVLNSVLDN